MKRMIDPTTIKSGGLFLHNVLIRSGQSEVAVYIESFSGTPITDFENIQNAIYFDNTDTIKVTNDNADVVLGIGFDGTNALYMQVITGLGSESVPGLSLLNFDVTTQGLVIEDEVTPL